MADRPVLSGFLALTAVALAVGLILGVGALLVARIVGVSGGDGGAGSANEQSMYIPPLEETESPEAREDGQGGERGGQPQDGGSEEAEETRIVLTAGQVAVAPMQQIDLRGSYPGGDGAILRVQRFESGQWIEFPVTASVNGGSFATYVQTGQGGVNRFRMYDADADEASNDVKVRVG